MERVVGVNGSNSKGVRAWMWGWRGEREKGTFRDSGGRRAWGRAGFLCGLNMWGRMAGRLLAGYAILWKE